ncbi:hypothetical protein RCH08_002838 [Janthinobacterium sp. CG_S6]|nr:hypothetical protein [Janthinobacterium sp. CG_S6]
MTAPGTSVLPHDAREALQRAAATPAIGNARTIAIEKAMRDARLKHPQFFKQEPQS